MFIRIMPKLHVVIKWLCHSFGDEHVEQVLQGTVAKPPNKRAKSAKETDEEAVVSISVLCLIKHFFDTHKSVTD